jgi:outer membrane receptor protein involved in Fe transport
MTWLFFLPLRPLARAVAGVALWLVPSFARAQPAALAMSEPPATAARPAIAEVVVSTDATPGLSLDDRPRTGSSLGLTARETPATVDVMTQRQMQDLGARTSEEALNRAPGVTASSNATSPGALSMRGFTGSGRAVLLLYDGVRPLEEAFFTRIIDSWMLERIEVLKGPASVDYGEGALAGVVNLVPKARPSPRGRLQPLVGVRGRYRFGVPGGNAERCLVAVRRAGDRRCHRLPAR